MKRIFRNRWLGVRPFHKDLPTDQYYIKLCNCLKERIYEDSLLIEKFDDLTEADYEVIVCLIVAYFEDVVSETRIFQTFTRICQKKCGNPLPFFPLEEYDEYLEDDINLADIEFLIWFYLASVFDTFVPAIDVRINRMAVICFDELDSHWDDAPVNLPLREHYTFSGDPNDFFAVRDFIKMLFLSNYLFQGSTTTQFRNYVREAYKDNAEMTQAIEEESIDLLTLGDSFLFEERDELWSIKMTEWALEYIQDPVLCRNLRTLSPKATGVFEYVSEDDNYFTLRMIGLNREYHVLKASFQDGTTLNEDNLEALSLIRWQGDWRFSGISQIIPASRRPFDELILDICKSSPAAYYSDYWDTMRQYVAAEYAIFLDEFGTDLLVGNEKQLKAYCQRFAETLAAVGVDILPIERTDEDTHGHLGFLYYDKDEGCRFFDWGGELFDEKLKLPDDTRKKIIEKLLRNDSCPVGLIQRIVDTYIPSEEGYHPLDVMMEALRNDFDFLISFYKTYQVLRLPPNSPPHYISSQTNTSGV